MVELFANSGDPDQTPRSAASDLGPQCLPVTRLGVSSLKWVNMSIIARGRTRVLLRFIASGPGDFVVRLNVITFYPDTILFDDRDYRFMQRRHAFSRERKNKTFAI